MRSSWAFVSTKEGQSHDDTQELQDPKGNPIVARCRAHSALIKKSV